MLETSLSRTYAAAFSLTFIALRPVPAWCPGGLTAQKALVQRPVTTILVALRAQATPARAASKLPALPPVSSPPLPSESSVSGTPLSTPLIAETLRRALGES